MVRFQLMITLENAIEEGEDFAPKQAAMVKEVLNLAARYGMNHLPKKSILSGSKTDAFLSYEDGGCGCTL